jgi:hypothetical protein
MLLLECASLLSFVLFSIAPSDNRSDLYVALVLLAIVALTCSLGFYQEGQSVRLMSSFTRLMPGEAKARVCVRARVAVRVCVCVCVCTCPSACTQLHVYPSLCSSALVYT